MSRLAGFVAGLLFAAGLALGGMTQPLKVISFLDFTGGSWDPSLALVMAGALAVYFVGFRVVVAQDRPVFADAFCVPTRRDMPPRLFLGATLFGIGWALAGFCPGPALVSFGAGMAEAFYFVPAMLVGMAIFGVWENQCSANQQGHDQQAAGQQAAGQQAPLEEGSTP